MREKRVRARRSRILPFCLQIGYWSEVCKIDFGEPGFLRTEEISASLFLYGKVA